MAKGMGSGWHFESRRHALASRGIRTASRIANAPQNRNLKMCPDVYVLRRKVINILYEIKKIDPDLPRIEVRISENYCPRLTDGKVLTPLARAYMGKENVIWISEKAVADSDLRTIVYHEVLHTIYKVPHSNAYKLMSPTLKKGLSEQVLKESYLELKQKYGVK